MTSPPRPAPPKPLPIIGTGMPATLRLETFGTYVDQAFGSVPFLVGSAARGKRWRDVDVRLILADDQFARLFPGFETAHQHDALWSLICDSISGLARQLTGLPVDFQIQPMTHANTLYGNHVRVPLLRIRSPEWQPLAEQATS